jgi:DHA1 family multidrug resistance protein-like MFS transporter
MLGLYSIGAALTFIPQTLATSVGALLAARFANGLFVGGTLPLANSIIARITPKSEQGTTYGISTSLQSAARAIGPLMGSGIAVAWGMRSVFGITGVLYAAMGLAVYIAIRDSSLRAAPVAAADEPPDTAPARGE